MGKGEGRSEGGRCCPGAVRRANRVSAAGMLPAPVSPPSRGTCARLGPERADGSAPWRNAPSRSARRRAQKAHEGEQYAPEEKAQRARACARACAEATRPRCRPAARRLRLPGRSLARPPPVLPPRAGRLSPDILRLRPLSCRVRVAGRRFRPAGGCGGLAFLRSPLGSWLPPPQSGSFLTLQQNRGGARKDGCGVRGHVCPLARPPSDRTGPPSSPWLAVLCLRRQLARRGHLLALLAQEDSCEEGRASRQERVVWGRAARARGAELTPLFVTLGPAWPGSAWGAL